MFKRSFIILLLLSVTFQTKFTSMKTATLDQLIAENKYEEIYRQICPAPTSKHTCKEYFDDKYRQMGGVQKPELITFKDDEDHVNYKYPNGFFVKSFTTFSMFDHKTNTVDHMMENYALHEINVGRKVFDSINVNGVRNMIALEDCCSQRLPTMGKDQKREYLLQFKYYPEGNLRQFIEAKENAEVVSNVAWKFSVSLGIVNAVRALHNSKYAHRDLKPDNVVMASNCDPLITDYGFNKKIIDTTDTIGGTPIFMPPEMKSDNVEYNLKIDMWNVGALIHYIAVPKPFSWTHDWRQRIIDSCQEPGDKIMKESNWHYFIYCKYFHHIILACVNENPDIRPSAEEVYYALKKSMDLLLIHGPKLYDLFKVQAEGAKCAVNDPFLEIVNQSYNDMHEWLLSYFKDNGKGLIPAIKLARPEFFVSVSEIVPAYIGEWTQYSSWIQKLATAYKATKEII